uniref:Uncharacterized protein n=1 Tax=Rhizophora mucronata TaxID=61149 RepID=A0A2P2QPM6_RHIMU
MFKFWYDSLIFIYVSLLSNSNFCSVKQLQLLLLRLFCKRSIHFVVLER